jgi:methyl-accepting chemotaxis protein
MSPLILLLILGGVAITSVGSIVQTNKWVDHTRVVLAEAGSILGSAVDMETGSRGYLLAGKEEFLDPYKNGEKATYAKLTALQQTVSDNPKQVARLNEANKILKEWQSKDTEPSIALRRQIGTAKNMNDMGRLVGEARGKVYFDAFRGQIATFIEREAILLVKRRADFQAALSAVERNAGGRRDADEIETMKKNEGWVSHNYKVIDKANGILAAVEEQQQQQQQASTGEIARNVEEAASGTSGVSANIVSVNQAAGETGRAASNVRDASQELAKQADQLKNIVGKFLTDVRAA